MKIRIQSIHFNADNALLLFIQEKVDKLVHFYDHILGGEVFLKLDHARNLPGPTRAVSQPGHRFDRYLGDIW